MSLHPVASDFASSLESGAGGEPLPAVSRMRSAPRETIDSRTLLRGGRELVIVHGEHEYRLRLTQNDKLILTK